MRDQPDPIRDLTADGDVVERLVADLAPAQLATPTPADGGQRVSGPAVDFCLLVARRRHRADLTLTAAGAEAVRWLDLANAYRGPAGQGRSPGQFAHLS